MRKKKDAGTDVVEAEAGEEAPSAKGGKGGKGNLVPAAVLAVGLLGAGWFMGGGSGGGASGTAAAGTTTTTTVVEGEVIALEPITLNLADDHFLKVGIAVQMKGGDTDKGGGGHGAKPADDVDSTARMAKALDEAITVFGGRTKEDLSSPAGREHAKEELSERVRERYHGEVLGVYFTEFVMQ